jgi:hypothetical protein
MYSMNKQRQSHMSGQRGESSGDVADKSGQHHPPHIHIHHDGSKVHVHIMHHNMPPEHHEHEPDDAEGIASHIHEHYGEGGSQPVGQHVTGDNDGDEMGMDF